jgi:serine/threonine-protein kinase
MQPGTLGKYELRGILGRGAVGTVYDGWDPAIARHVAIKTIRLPEAHDAETEEQLSRFRREAQAAGRLTHPNIVAVYDFGETPELAYLVMEFVEGDSLKTVLDRDERLPLAQVLQLMQQLLEGLQYSHEHGVVHRDIKPGNLMLTRSGTLKITDFGIARIEGGSATQVGTVLGTPAYMSPEQWQGVPVDARADIYSAGVLLYHLLTGERPFEGGSTSAIMHKALHTEPVAPSQLSVSALPALDPIVLKAMARRPEDRYASAATFADALRAFTTTTREEADRTIVASTAKRPATAPAPVRSVDPKVSVTGGRRRSAAPTLVALAVILLSAGAGAYWYFPVRTPSAPLPGQTSFAPAPAAPPPSPPEPSSETSVPHANTETPQASLPPPPAVPSTPKPEAALPSAPVGTATVQPGPPPAASVPPAPSPPSQAEPPLPAPQASLVSPPVVHEAPLPAPAVDLHNAVAQLDCALITGEASPTRKSVAGLLAKDQLPALRQAFDLIKAPSQSWAVESFERSQVFCTALETLRAAEAASGDPASGFQLKLVQPHADNALRDGDLVRAQVTMPDFDAWLTVDYISSGGELSHMLPRAAGDQAYPPQHLPARAHRSLFEPAGAFKGWAAGTPYGTDMIIAVASTQPLALGTRTDDEPQAGDYLRVLRSAIAAARGRGAAVAATAILVNTLPPQ